MIIRLYNSTLYVNTWINKKADLEVVAFVNLIVMSKLSCQVCFRLELIYQLSPLKHYGFMTTWTDIS